MLSRVADCAYWMSRYLERAEHTARLGDVCLGLTLDRSSDTVRRLMSTVGTPPKGYGVPLDPKDERNPEVRLNRTIEACVAAARENARQVREQISTEMWEQLNRLYLNVSRSRTARGSVFYGHIKEASHLFQGVTDSTMMHTEGWHYIQIGRSIERASATATPYPFGGVPTVLINRRTVSDDRSSVRPRHTSPSRAVCSARSR